MNLSTAQPAPTPDQRRPLIGTKVGVVTSDKRNKTRTVTVAYQTRHPKYGKYLKRVTRYHVHDPQNLSKMGDRVEIANCRPISKTKSWRLIRVLESGVPGEAEPVTTS